MSYSTGETIEAKVIYFVTTLVLLVVFYWVYSVRLAECSARTYPFGLSPVLTTEGCVCLLRAK